MDKEEYEELIENAYVWMYNNNNPTATGLQRHLGWSYYACQSIIDELEERGWISKQEGAKKRELLACPGCFQEQERCECGNMVY